MTTEKLFVVHGVVRGRRGRPAAKVSTVELEQSLSAGSLARDGRRGRPRDRLRAAPREVCALVQNAPASLYERVFARYNGRQYGCRRARRPRRPRAQPQGHHRPPAAEPPDLHHRAVRLRQVLARLRHDLRGGAAPLRRVALRLRAAVPADDGEAGRRPHRRPEPCDLDRPEDDLAEPALDGRHGDGDLPIICACLCACRAPALPVCGKPIAGSRSTRSSTRCFRSRTARGSPSTRRWCVVGRARSRIVFEEIVRKASSA